MALWEVVSQDEAGEAPSVSLREIIHAGTHLASCTKQVITTVEEQGVLKRETIAFSGNSRCLDLCL